MQGLKNHIIFLLAFALAIATLGSCSEKSITNTRSLALLLGEVTLDSDQVELAVGRSATIHASVSDFAGKPLSEDGLSFSTSGCSENIATVETSASSIKVTATGVGSCTLTTTASGFSSASTKLTVTEAAIDTIVLSPETTSVQTGSAVQFSATAEYSDGTTKSITAKATWSASPASAATVTAGRVVGRSSGRVTVTAVYEGVSGSAVLTVSNSALSSLMLINGLSTNYVGVSQSVLAIGVYADGSVEDLSNSVTWSSSSPTVTSIDSSGTSSNLSSGSTTIAASLNGVTGSQTTTVNAATLSSLAIVPGNVSLPSGYTIALKAVGTYSDGMQIDLSNSVTWSSSVTAKATVSNSAGSRGTVTGVAAGTSVITATLLSVSSSATVHVSTATLSSIAVVPSTASLGRGTKKNFAAIGTFSDSSVLDLTSAATWSSNDSGATVSDASSSKGLVTAVSAATANITATLNAISDAASVTVTSATLDAIAITPSNPTIDTSDRQQFVATATYSDASTADVTNAATWTSNTPATAIISDGASSKGLSAAVAAGTSTIKATVNGVEGTTTMTVTAGVPGVATGITVTPPAVVLSNGATQQFAARSLKSDGSTTDVTNTASWTSSQTGVATVNGTGLLTAVSEGSTVISASLGSYTTNIQVTVTNDQVAPGAPTGLTGSASSASDLSYSWTANGATTSYYKYAYKQGGAAPADCDSDTHGTTTASSVALSGLLGNTSYTLLVCACNSDTVVDCSAATAGLTKTTFDAVVTPTFSPVAGDYNDAQTVTISTTTGGSTIYYTTDGSTPTTASTAYTVPVSIANPSTLKAIAVKAAYADSSVGSAAYTFTAATPTVSSPAGTYATNQSISLSSTTTGASIYYTTDGSAPTASSTAYTGAISVNSSQTLKAIATKSGWTSSSVASSAYVITGSVAYSATSLSEAVANDGSISATIVLTLSNDTFTAGPFNDGDEFSITAGAVPAGLTLALTRDSTTQLTLSLTGNASSHANANDTSFTIGFNTAAFTRGVVPAAGAGGSKAISIDFADPSGSCLYGGVSVGGACWYYADVFMGCTAKCGMLTLSDDAATETYAGTSGSLANCQAVIDALNGGPSAYPATSIACHATNTEDTGCYWEASITTPMWCNDGTTAAAAPGFPSTYRACACQ